MELCLVRHAIAGDREAWEGPDAERPLTDRGRARMEEASLGLRQLFKAQAIISSPLTRARETAEILLDAYGLSRLYVTDALACGDDGRLAADVAEIGATRVIAVGHEPYMSGTLSWALAGDSQVIASVFRKGAAALVSFPAGLEPGAGTLEWLLQPAALRGLGPRL